MSGDTHDGIQDFAIHYSMFDIRYLKIMNTEC